MRQLIAYRNQIQSGSPIIVYVNVLSAVNVHEVQDMVDLAIDLGVDEVRFQLMHFGNEQTDHMMLQPRHLHFLATQIDEIVKKLKDAHISLLDNFEWQVKQTVKNLDEDNEVKTCDWALELFSKHGCYTGYFFTRTWVDGRVSFCCHDRVVGDLKEESLKSQWNGEKYSKIREVAAHFDLDSNMLLHDGHKGGWLLADDCSWCGNYEIMNHAHNLLDGSGLHVYMRHSRDNFKEITLGQTHEARAPIDVGLNSYKPEQFIRFNSDCENYSRDNTPTE